ncbi:hypothetical protein E5D57_007926 [Metarhizium anisopliae]|nr:hypothetical protein E5D57_007926 [Metarhizium anisopliae]
MYEGMRILRQGLRDRSSTPRTYEKNIREKKPYNIPRQQGEMEYSKPRLDPQTPHGVSPATASSPTDQ